MRRVPSPSRFGGPGTWYIPGWRSLPAHSRKSQHIGSIASDADAGYIARQTVERSRHQSGFPCSYRPQQSAAHEIRGIGNVDPTVRNLRDALGAIGQCDGRQMANTERGRTGSHFFLHQGDLLYQNSRLEVAAYTAKGNSFVPEMPRVWSMTPLGVLINMDGELRPRVPTYRK